MEDKNAARTRNIGAVFYIMLLIVGVAAALLIAEVSDSTKVLLLGSTLLIIGIWGRRKLRHG